MRPLILVKYHFASLWNWRSSYLGRFIEPVAYLLFLATGLRSSLERTTGQYGLFVLTGMVCLLAFRAATASMSDVANDRKWGVFAIYTLQGGSVLGYVASVVVFACSVFLGQFVVLVACAFAAFGDAVPEAHTLFAEAGLGLLLVVGWCGLGASVGGRVDSYSTRDLLVTVTTLPVILAAPLFYPIDDGWLRWVAAVNPLTYQVGVLREASWLVAGATVLWTCFGVAVAVVSLRRAERVSRER
ncbi:ABC transporter permease [Curtobacterium sp. RRHDQ10]|uniref:ABC transporter permease n=1 Tax=Curtobacterium phyllosphaerae TaxID=3413379 RepID=UPI003BF0A179